MRIPKKRKIRINLMKHLNTTTLRNQLKRRINLMKHLNTSLLRNQLKRRRNLMISLLKNQKNYKFLLAQKVIK
jgi:hypothetical protein